MIGSKYFVKFYSFHSLEVYVYIAKKNVFIFNAIILATCIVGYESNYINFANCYSQTFRDRSKSTFLNINFFVNYHLQ
jgi:hypothetical protein